MKKNFFILISSLLLFSCRQAATQNDRINTELDSLDVVLTNLLHTSDSLTDSENQLLEKQKKLIPKSPAGYKIYMDIGGISLADNKRFKIDINLYRSKISLLKHNASEHYSIESMQLYGDWKKEKDSVILHVNFATGYKKFTDCYLNVRWHETVDTLIVCNWVDIVLHSFGRKDKISHPYIAGKNVVLKDVEYEENYGKYPFLSWRNATENDLKNHTAEELQIMRSEILARVGYKFSEPFLDDYFRQFDWYRRLFHNSCKDNVMLFLTDIEKYNIEFIKKHE
jgi:hypothetical protein